MTDQKSWLEAVLQRKHFNESPINVVEAELVEGVIAKGENYLSKIEKVKGTVLLGSGKTKKVSLIIKNEHNTGEMKKVSQQIGIFFREITMYRDILPKMEELLDDMHDGEGIFWGRCIDYRLFDRIVFEDLGESGYKMANRINQLGLDAALLAIKTIAKFHALSCILWERGELPADLFGSHIWAKAENDSNNEFPTKVINDNVMRLIPCVRKWGDEWQEAADRLEKAAPGLSERYIKELVPKPDDFIVLCHGDFWTNNMMFKGDLEKPTSIKLLDLQLVGRAPPSLDFHALVVSSVRPHVVRKHYDDLVEQYSRTLVFYLNSLNYKGRIPTLDEMKEDFAKKSLTLLGWSLTLGILITRDTSGDPEWEETARMEKEAKEKGDPSLAFNPYEKLNDETVEMYKLCLEKSMEFGTI